jgi:hypothetical protein
MSRLAPSLATLPRRALLAMLPAALVVPQAARAGQPAISAPDGLALRGADPVAYVLDGAHVPGRSDHGLMWRGAVWLFDRTETMTAFEMDPTAYCPDFGGYCAFAMSHGMIVDGDPRAWLLHDGAVYLCSSPLALAGLRRDLAGNIAAARANWPAILDG